MKKEVVYVLMVVGVILIMGFVWRLTYKEYRKASDERDIAMANVKNYDKLLSESEDRNVALQLSLAQFKVYGDSVVRELDETRRQLRIKDKNLKSLQQVVSEFSRKDTIVLSDTIFKEPDFRLDTLINDNWYSLQLGLSYPSTIAVQPDFISEKHVVVSSKRETVNPPKKFFLLRWFQKRHTVLSVDVVEKNPYVHGESSRFIEIID